MTGDREELLRLTDIFFQDLERCGLEFDFHTKPVIAYNLKKALREFRYGPYFNWGWHDFCI